MMIKIAARITTYSGRILIPWVSSSKKRNNPALEAGIGALFLSFLELKESAPSWAIGFRTWS
jgi:hypothetical protein